jgi:hypothetical protein
VGTKVQIEANIVGILRFPKGRIKRDGANVAVMVGVSRFILNIGRRCY